MATRKKSSSRKAPAKKRSANPIDDALARLERDIPRLLRQLRGNVKDLKDQVDRARTDGEKRWRDAEKKVKRDATQLRQRLEKAIGRMRSGAKAAKARTASAISAKRGAKTKPAKRKSGTRKRRSA